VFLNGVQVTRFENADDIRGLPTAPAAPSYLGLQAHPGSVASRNIHIHTLKPAEVPKPPTAVAATVSHL
jgi:hypothetical protein